MTTVLQKPQPPAVGSIYDLDAAHSSATFSVRHLMIANVRGSMAIRRGTIAVTPEGYDVDAELDVASIHTGIEARDAHLRSADFFDAETHPTMTFRARGVKDPYRVKGDLTIRGVTRPVVLDVELEGDGIDATGKRRAGATATTTIDRSLWGLTWNQALEAGGVMVGDKVKVTLDLQAVERV